MKTLKSIIVAALCAVGITAFAEPVGYLDWDDVNKKMTNAVCTAYTVVRVDTETFEAGKTYVVQGTVEQSVHGITVEGTSSNPTRLILCDGAKLTVTGQSAAETAGLNVGSGSAIVICGQNGGTGVLETTGGAGAAGIGGNAGQAAGTVTIYGGSVTALGKNGGAGIGGGMYNTDTGTVTFGAKFIIKAGADAASAQPIAQDDYKNDHSATYVHIEPAGVAQFVKGGEVVAKFATADEAVAALDDAQYADIEEFRIGLAADTVFDFGGRTNRVVILNVGDVENTLKNVLLDCAGDYAVTGMVGTVVFGDGVRIEKETGFMGGLVTLIIKGGLYKSDPSWYCEDGYFGARRCDANAALNGLYAILPEAEIAVTVSKWPVTTHYATLQDAFNLAIGENEEVTLRLFNNLKLGTAVAKLEGNKVIHLLPGESGTNTITRVGPEPVIEIGLSAKLEIKNVVFDGANVPSEKPMIKVAGKTAGKFGWLIAGDGFVVSNAVGGAVHVGKGGKFELDGVAKIIENTTGGKPKNVIIEDSAAIQLTACGAVTDGNYAQIGVWSETAKFMIPGGQFGTVNTSYEYATDFADGDISVAKPWVGFINDLDGSLHHAAGAKTAAAGKKNYKRWVGGEYKELVEEGDYLISREKSIVSVSPELIWTARQEAPAAELAPAVLDWTDTTFTLKVLNGCDYALVTSGSTETNWVSMVKTNAYVFARPEGGDCICLSRYSITPSNVVSAATAYPVSVPTGAKDNPWFIGATYADNVTAYTNWTGNLFVEGEGVMKDFESAAPWASDAVTEAVIGEHVTTIGAHAFAECPNLKMLALYGQTPPSLGAGNDFTGVTVVVPGGAGPVYAAADGWKNFNLVEMCGPAREVTGQLYAVDYEWYDFVLAERFAELVAVDDPLKDRGGDTNAHRRGIRCLAVRKDGLVGRNLDAALSDADEYVVRTSAAYGRPHATLAIANEGFFRQANRMMSDVELAALRPVFIDDGVNDAGLVVSANSIFSRSAGVTEDTNPDGAWLVQPLVTRYLLDYAGSAAEALEILTNCSTRALWKNKESECHWLIADPDETYVVECVSNRIVALKVPQGKAAAMTNYLLARSPHSSDFEALVGGNLISAEHTPYARGIERYEAAMSALASVDGTEAMLALLKDQRYSQVYAAGRERDFWSEANGEMVDLATPGGGIGNYHTFTVSDGSEFDEARMSFFANERAKDEARRKKTIHSAVYDIAAQKVRIAVQEDYAKAYDFWIVEPDPGCEKNPWKVGDNGEEPPRYAEAYTNGTELVIGGAGAVADLSEIPSAVKGGLTAITIAEVTVTVAASDAFQGFGASGSEVSLTLPDNWQGDLPDEEGNWYGAKVTLTAVPLAVKNVTFLQRYPWNGKVDVSCDLTGSGKVTLSATVLTNGVKFVEAETIVGEATLDLDAAGGATNGVKFVWDAAADLPAGFKVGDISIEMAVEKVLPGQLWKGGPIWAECNVGATKPEEPGCYFWWGDTIGYAYDGSKWVSVDGMDTVIKFSDAPANSSQNKDVSTLMSEGWIDAGGNLVADRDAATAHLGTSWRMPTRDEFDALTNTAYCTSVWTDNYNGTGVAGRIVTGATDGYTDRSIFLPASGRGYSANYDRPGTYGAYWSSTPQADSAIGAWYLNIDSDTFKNEYGFYRSDGCTVRPVQDAPEISAESAEGFLDLTVGDRIAAAEEPIVVDPAWGEASEAQVQIDGEGSMRTYSSASIDTWNTASLEPGRYAMALTAGTDAESAAFWKTGADWVVFNSSNVTADVTFEAGKTYLFFGTNTINGATLTVQDGAKFFYDEGAPAGFKAASVAELPKRYEIAGGVDPADESKLFQIVEKPRGSEDNPWDVGEGVAAYTNGTELVIGGEGTVADISEIPTEIKGGITAINVASNGVAGVASDAFQGVGDGEISLTLPDGWQGELPDESGNWYGATVNLVGIPLSVKNVEFRQRYPWNGKVDVGFTLTGPAGETNVVVTVCTNGTKIADLTAAVAIPEDGVLATNLVWDAATAGLVDDFKSDDVTVEVAPEGAPAISAKSAAGTFDLRTNVALAEGETTVSNVTWSATLWGELDEEFVTAIGWTNLTTGATGVFSNLAGVVGDAAEDADLPKKDGDYRLTHSTGDLTSFVKFTVSGYPLGSEGNPWEIGAEDPASVKAYTNGVGTLMVTGTGVMKDFDDDAPWETIASDIKSVDIGADVTKLGDGAFDRLTGVASNILENAEMPINPAAFADGTGMVTEPAVYLRNEDGGLDEVLEYMLEDGTVYETLQEVLDAGVTEIFGVTLPIAKEQAIEGLKDLAFGEDRDEPVSEAVTNALEAAIAAIQAVDPDGSGDPLDELADAAEEGYFNILVLVSQERDLPIGDSNLTWRVVVEGSDTNLVIQGEGEMPDFDGDDSDGAPWDPIAGIITGVDAGDGVGSFGNEAFMLCDNLREMVLGNPTMPVNLNAFLGEYYDDDLGETVAATNLPTSATLRVGDTEIEPDYWFGEDGTPYDTIQDALEAGCQVVTALTEVPLTLEAGVGGGLRVEIDGGSTVVDIPAGTQRQLDVLAGSRVVVTPLPNEGFTTFDAPVTIDALIRSTSLPAFAFVPNPDATLRWKLCKAAGRYVGQVAITARAGYESAIQDLAFLFEDRSQGGSIYAQLWDLTARSAVSDTLEENDTMFRSAALGASPFEGVAAGARTVFGLSDTSYASANLRIPTGEEARIALYVGDRKNPVSGNETAGEPETFLCFLTWTTDGVRYFLPMAEGAANGALTKERTPVMTTVLSPRKLSSAVSLGLPLPAAAENSFEAKIIAFEVGPETISGRVEVSAGMATSTTYSNGATVTIYGSSALGGSMDVIAEASVDLSTGLFTIPATAVEASGAMFFKATVAPSNRQIVE